MAGYRLPAGVPSLLTEHEVLRPRPIDWHPGAPRGLARLGIRRARLAQAAALPAAGLARLRPCPGLQPPRRRAIAELAPEVAARVRVSPFGLTLPAAADPAREQPDSLLFVGNFTHQPNRDAALWLAREIMPALLAQHPGARLRIVGSALRPRSSPSPAARSRSSPTRRASSPTPEAAAVVVAPVRVGGGMRMKVLQALGAGKAVVTTSRGSEGFDCFAEPPPLALADDAGSFAAAIAALLG